MAPNFMDTAERKMASPADDLRNAMLAQLRASSSFSKGVGGRISDRQPREFPCAWVGVTMTEDGTDGVSLIVTLHVWKRSGEETATDLLREAEAMFATPPQLASLSITSWEPDHSEVRLNVEQSAYRGLTRFRAHARPA